MTGNRHPPTLTHRDLNRASLARQLLLERSGLSVDKAMTHLVAIQAQAHRPPYIGLWARLRDVTTVDCDGLLTDRQLVRLPLMRGTLHLATARDALALTPLFDDLLARGLRSNFGRQLDGIDIEAVARAAEEILERAPQTYADLGRQLAQTWPDRDPASLAQVARHLLKVVQAPPLLWSSSERPEVTTQRRWLSQKPAAATPRETLVRRYLAAFGPASVADMQKWLGFTGLQPVLEEMTGHLRVFRSPDGEALYDLPEAPRPDADAKAPARLLPGFDAVVLGYRNPARFVAADFWPRLSSRNGLFHPVFLLDGRIAGLWKLSEGKGGLSVVFEPFAEITRRDRTDLAAEAEALARFTGHDRTEVSFHGS
ncbi:winged helix DNA-binding domain-containing protein [Nitratireductor sp. ac15]